MTSCSRLDQEDDMSSDRFERDLEDQTLRPVPAAWRQEILKAVQPEQVEATASRSRVGAGAGWGWDWLWPRRVALGGLAAAWLAIFTLNWAANRPDGSGVGESAFSPEVIALALRQSRQIVNELEGSGTAQPIKIRQPRSALPLTMEWRAV